MRAKIWNKLTWVSGAEETEEHTRARFLAALLVVSWPLIFIIGLLVLPYWMNPEAPLRTWTFWAGFDCVVAGAIAFAANRRGRHDLACWVYVAGLASGIPVASLEYGGHLQFLAVLTIVTLVLLRSRAAVAVATATTLGAHIFVYLVQPADSSNVRLVVSLCCNLFLICLLVVVRVYHEHLEERRLRTVQRRERWFSTTLSSIGDAVMTVDRDHNITFINAVAQKLTGYDSASAVGTKAETVFCIRNEYSGEPVDSPIPRVLAEGKIVGLANHTILIARDGTRRPIADSGAPIVDETGTVHGVVLVFRDQTQEHAVQARIEHSQRLDALGQLAGGVAHDFNNLLTAIGGSAEITLEQLAKDDPARADLEDVLFGTQRAVALTSQLLAFSRRQVMQAKSVAFDQAVESALRLLRRLLPETVTVQTELPKSAGWVQVDTVQFEQVVINLALNASDAMPGGGTLTFSTSQIQLTDPDNELGLPCGSYSCLSVRDTGTGMDEKTQRRVFEPFFTTKARGRGTGLGLATVYGIVQQSGGGVQVQSQVGKGSEFTVYLPSAQAMPAGTSRSTPPPSRPSERTVLLIEDDPMVRRLAERALSAGGFVVLTAASGAEAIQLMAGTSSIVDVVVTDIVMPGMSGTVAAAEVRRRFPEVRVLYMSGYADEILAREGVGQGAAFLPKPFTPGALRAAVERAMGSVEQPRDNK